MGHGVWCRISINAGKWTIPYGLCQKVSGFLFVSTVLFFHVFPFLCTLINRTRLSDECDNARHYGQHAVDIVKQSLHFFCIFLVCHSSLAGGFLRRHLLGRKLERPLRGLLHRSQRLHLPFLDEAPGGARN